MNHKPGFSTRACTAAGASVMPQRMPDTKHFTLRGLGSRVKTSTLKRLAL